MSEAKNEGLEVVAWQFKQNGKWYLGSNTNDHKSNTISAGYPVRELCLLDKALAGYAVRDARIAELRSELVRQAIDNNQLRAELAAAKETISRYETTAENCEAFRDALATPAPIPDRSEDVRAMVVPDRSDVHTSSQPTG